MGSLAGCEMAMAAVLGVSPRCPPAVFPRLLRVTGDNGNTCVVILSSPEWGRPAFSWPFHLSFIPGAWNLVLQTSVDPERSPCVWG